MLIENMENKQVLEYTKPVDLSKLMNEIFDTIPELIPRFEDNEWDVKIRIFTNNDNLTIWVPENIDSGLIDTIIDDHTINTAEVIDNAISSDK